MSSVFPDFYANDAGTWREANQMYYNDGGTWRELSEVCYNDQGTWRRVFTNERINITNQTSSQTLNSIPGPATANANYQLTKDGEVFKLVSGVTTAVDGEWYSQEPVTDFGANYEVRATITSDNGNGSFTGTTGAWTSLATTQTWSLSQTGSGVEITARRELLIEIREAASGTVITSATITLRAALFGP